MKKQLVIIISLNLALTSCIPVLVGSAIVSGISVLTDRRDASQVVDDKIISMQVRKVISKDIVNDEHIKVMTYNGVVLLAGEAENVNDKIQAEDSAASKKGVIRVINELKQSIPTTITRRTKDSFITSKAKSSLVKIKIKGFNPTRVRIMTIRGEVYLMGKVTRAEAAAVVEKIRNLRGVKKVVKVFEYI